MSESNKFKEAVRYANSEAKKRANPRSEEPEHCDECVKLRSEIDKANYQIECLKDDIHCLNDKIYWLEFELMNNK